MPIGFYVRKPVILPHLDYPEATLYVIQSALQEAWKVLRDLPEGDFDIKVADEDRITRELRTCLMNSILDGGQVPGFTSDIFYITRDGKFESYNGAHLDKMPDIHIHVGRKQPVSIPSADGLFIECKPVDRDHPAGSTYCDKGISRFVSGEYAWASSQAMMVGYAASKYTIRGKLQPTLTSKATTLGLIDCLTPCINSKSSRSSQEVHISKHERRFVIPLTGMNASAITIRHIWLNRH